MSRSHITHLMYHHYVTDTKILPIYSRVATFNLCPWPLPASQRIILRETSAHPLHCNLCLPRSVLLPRRIGIVFQGVSHSSQSRSHVTHHMSLIWCLIITSPISCHSSHVLIFCHSSHISNSCHSSHVTHHMPYHYVTHLSSHHYVTDTKLLPTYSRVATFNFCPWPLPNSPRIILPVTSAQPLHSNLCPPRSVILPRRIGIKFKGVSHSS